jgi:nitrogen fixation NifU-like protein
MDNNLYRENLMDHYKNPRNRGKLVVASVSSAADNPFCGDSLSIDLLVENGIIEDFKFDGEMCAVGIAAASMLSEEIIGKSIEEAKKFDKDKMLSFFSDELTTSRIKCATLALEALQEGIKKYEQSN